MSAKMSSKELKSIFEKYAAREGDPNQLSKNELTLLIQTEFPSLLKVSAQLQSWLKWASEGGKGGERKGHGERLRSVIQIRAPSGGKRTAAKVQVLLKGEHLNMCFPPLVGQATF